MQKTSKQIVNSFDDSYLEAAEKYLCEISFYDFFVSFWDVLVPESLVDNWHIKYICDELQEASRYLWETPGTRGEKEYDLVINVPPGSTKTTMILQAFPAWLWVKDKTIRIISSSHSEPLSIESNMKTRDLIRSPKYGRFWGIKIRADKMAKKAYENYFGGTRDATSTGSSITGRHSHVKLMDDLQEISKASSEPDRVQAIEHMKTLATREVEKGNSLNVLVMQRLHEMDATAYFLESKKGRVKHICLPAELSDKVSPPELKSRYTDGLLDPIRMSRKILDEKKRELGTYGYSAQFSQDPKTAEGNIVKREWFKIRDRGAVPFASSPIMFFIDTAYEKKKNVSKKTGEAKNDPTGLLACFVHNGFCYITGYEEVYMELPDLVEYVPKWCRKHGYTDRSLVMIEPKASGKSTVQTLVRNTKMNVKEIEGGKDSKETELRNASASVESGRFILMQDVWNELFIDRVCAFPHGAHDEAVDLLCYAKKYYFGADNELKKDEILEKALQFFQ